MELDQRYFNAIRTLYDLSKRGTLWKTMNTVWKRAIPHFVEKRRRDGSEGCHAGLALGRRVSSITDIYPMCIGTSKLRGKSLCVANVFSSAFSGVRASRTYFAIRPWRVCVGDFFIDGKRRISPWPGKSRLSDEELAEFNAMLRSRGLHI